MLERDLALPFRQSVQTIPWTQHGQNGAVVPQQAQQVQQLLQAQQTQWARQQVYQPTIPNLQTQTIVTGTQGVGGSSSRGGPLGLQPSDDSQNNVRDGQSFGYFQHFSNCNSGLPAGMSSNNAQQAASMQYNTQQRRHEYTQAMQDFTTRRQNPKSFSRYRDDNYFEDLKKQRFNLGMMRQT